MDRFLAWWQQSTEGLNLDWLEHVGLMLGAAAIAWLVWRFVFSKLVEVSKKTRTQWDTIVLQAVSTPVSVFIWLWPTTFAIGSLLDASVVKVGTDWLVVSRRALLIILMLWVMLRLVNAIEAYLSQSNKRDQTTVSAIGHVLRLLLAFIGVLTLLQEFGISLTGLLTFGGVGGLIVGLAAKDLLSNFFGGLMIYFDRPFSVGDWISSPDRNIEGTVERIGMRMTVIRTFESRPLYVPNSVFSNIVVQNPSRMRNRRINETIGIRYKDADKMEAIVDDVKNMLKTHPDIEQRATLMVNFDAFADSSLNFFIYTFTKTVNWARYHEVKQDVMLKIVDIVHAHGADFAFPTRTVAFDRDDVINAQISPSPELAPLPDKN
ncbi:mechanosensitive ion channel family protein [Grimontia hollisae]|uniref:MscS family inner membrane protein YnaI n=1 Tax=Grimontia hollisae TaxID=673 RepID=A0A377HHZ1_GRIHO|nr:mechanosensitive ion channel family protein [Grimontia hollisae]MDF2186753.1 mechanosensitive ion channel family protein [Grimontia hollisae]STO55766.1 MscS family inner membrane protein YnaI [Grimontia hollisae]STQ77912.1 MscS family inner membrane protein YnaI [Grimontia hollisae]